MNWTSSFEAMGEAMILRVEGEQALAREISKQVSRLFAKLTGRVKTPHAMAK